MKRDDDASLPDHIVRFLWVAEMSSPKFTREKRTAPGAIFQPRAQVMEFNKVRQADVHKQ
jgi:hypothetical protein